MINPSYMEFRLNKSNGHNFKAAWELSDIHVKMIYITSYLNILLLFAFKSFPVMSFKHQWKKNWRNHEYFFQYKFKVILPLFFLTLIEGYFQFSRETPKLLYRNHQTIIGYCMEILKSCLSGAKNFKPTSSKTFFNECQRYFILSLK